MVEFDQKSVRSDSAMGFGVTTISVVLFRRGKLNEVSDALSRQPCEVLQQMTEVENT